MTWIWIRVKRVRRALVFKSSIRINRLRADIADYLELVDNFVCSDTNENKTNGNRIHHSSITLYWLFVYTL